jgi:Fe-S oxidoreductase
VDRRGKRLVDELAGDGDGPTVAFLDDPRREDELWKAREAGLGATAYPPQGRETHEGWEDAAVPPDRLGEYLRDFRRLLDRYGYASASLYGHFGHGCVHTRMPTDLRTAEGIAAYRRFAEEAAHLVAGYGGSLSGEHGDGQSRGELLPIMFGDRVVHAFGELKALFDPDNRMNPGKVVHPYRLDENLRQGVAFRPWQPSTHFAFPHDDHRFANAAARCVGVGKCRGHEDGVMCPSYRVTREEEHSTRGRARLLFEMVQGEVITDGWRSTEVRDALDLCLACKGCRSDCPVDVDMATYKAEFLSHHYAGRLRPPAHYSMGWLPLWARIAALAPRAVNTLTHLPGLARLIKAAGGVTPQRELPRFAARRFTNTFRGAGDGRRGAVLLWPDTFTNNFHPEIARAAVDVLTDAGFAVTVPSKTVCCGLTWISTGQLGVARRVLRRTLDALRRQLRDGTPILVLEPSCAAVFRADLPELLHGDEDAHRLAGQTRTLAELLTERAPDWRPPAPVGRRAILQPHCHQHAVLGTAADRAVLDRAGVDAEVLNAGCCGLAGNFGFERGHYDVSMACAEDKLLPAVRGAHPDTLVLADGFSCRTQIESARTGRTPRHLAEVLAGALDRG